MSMQLIDSYRNDPPYNKIIVASKYELPFVRVCLPIYATSYLPNVILFMISCSYMQQRYVCSLQLIAKVIVIFFKGYFDYPEAKGICHKLMFPAMLLADYNLS